MELGEFKRVDPEGAKLFGQLVESHINPMLGPATYFADHGSFESITLRRQRRDYDNIPNFVEEYHDPERRDAKELEDNLEQLAETYPWLLPRFICLRSSPSALTGLYWLNALEEERDWNNIPITVRDLVQYDDGTDPSDSPVRFNPGEPREFPDADEDEEGNTMYIINSYRERTPPTVRREPNDRR